MNKVAKFEKISLDQWMKDMKELFPKSTIDPDMLKVMWENITLPTRSTKKSAGYDFFAPFEFVLRPGCVVTIPTGIRCRFEDQDYSLVLMPKSGIGCKTSIHLSNTVGLIDADYYNSKNEGHILIQLEMPSEPSGRLFSPGTLFGNDLKVIRKAYKVEADAKFVQGVFLPYGVTIDDDETVLSDRDGGFGSTSQPKPSESSSDTQNRPPINSGSGDPFTDPDAEEITDDDIADMLNM